MDKIDEIVRGVKFLAPGIIVVFIVDMFANPNLDQFKFLVFAATAVILISFVTDAFLFLLSGLIWGGSLALAKAMMPVSPTFGPRLEISFSRARTIVDSARLASQFSLALLIGILLVNLYEADSFYKYMRRFVSAQKSSQRDVLNRVTSLIDDGQYKDIDQRPDEAKPCDPHSKDCLQGVYLRILTKPGDIYEGATRYFPTYGEVVGLYLSPACVYRAKGEFEHGAIAKVSGPGVYVSMSDVSSIEYLDNLTSSCFAQFYPALAKP